MNVEQWNTKNPVGTRVRFWSYDGVGRLCMNITTTCSEAYDDVGVPTTVLKGVGQMPLFALLNVDDEELDSFRKIHNRYYGVVSVIAS